MFWKLVIFIKKPFHLRVFKSMQKGCIILMRLKHINALKKKYMYQFIFQKFSRILVKVDSPSGYHACVPALANVNLHITIYQYMSNVHVHISTYRYMSNVYMHMLTYWYKSNVYLHISIYRYMFNVYIHADHIWIQR